MSLSHREIVDYCLCKQGAYVDFPFGPDCLVIKVKAPSQEKGRIFAQIFMLRGEPKLTLNCTPESAEFYRKVYPNSVTRGFHCPPIQQPHFNTLSLDGLIPDAEIKHMINHAYEVVVSKLPKYFRVLLSDVENGTE